jgi:hypothetical protein
MGSVAVTNQTGHPVTKVTNNASGKRTGVSFDTGTAQGKDSRYQAVKSQILAGQLRPSTGQLRKHWQCNYETAAAYLSALHQEGLLERNEANGQYALVKLEEAG